jgi:UDP:flavonoid glycosyltransferase YjiC (YdhE family)
MRECIMSGVPMLFFQVSLDGPGLGERAEFHGLGLMLKQVSPKEIKQKLHELLTVSYYRLNV